MWRFSQLKKTPCNARGFPLLFNHQRKARRAGHNPGAEVGGVYKKKKKKEKKCEEDVEIKKFLPILCICDKIKSTKRKETQ